jgi:uncharacterized membrane protein
MRDKSPIYITLTAAFAALYAVGVVFLAPISFQIFQVRLADALLPLAIIFGWPAIVGLALGAFVANFFGGLGPVDIIGGAIANLLATFLAWRISHLSPNKIVKLIGVGIEIIVVTSIVGTYLSFLFGMPLQVGLLGVFLGSLIATGILGTILLFIFSTPRITVMLKSHGLIRE